jgi:hypothetical protein
VTDPFHPPFHELRHAALMDARVLVMDGEQWQVYELPHSALDRRSGTCLIFESDAAVRRVRSYPENWRALSNDELAAIGRRS